MKMIGRMLLMLALLMGATGCELYRTSEGVGVLGPTGGYFWCDDDAHCTGTPG